jgi:transcriptional regulator with XRE-family HTH domain
MITGETIRLIRNWKKLKQKTVADKLGISQPAYSKLEKHNHINPERLQKLLVVFNCTDSDLELFRKIVPAERK